MKIAAKRFAFSLSDNVWCALSEMNGLYTQMAAVCGLKTDIPG